MGRALATLITAAALGVQGATAQAVRPRSGDYLFVSTADDARAIWLNPAGLAVVLEASVMAEIAVDRPVGSDLRLGQWTVGFNSRGVAFGFQRDRFPDGSATNTFRFGTGFSLRRTALGAAYTIYRGTRTDQGGDIGLRYRLLDVLHAGVVLRNVGRPIIHDSLSSLTWVAGLGWIPVPQIVTIATEVRFTERVAASGYDRAYRTGIRLATRGRLPIGAAAAVDLGSNFKIDAFAVGVTVGAHDQLVALASAVPTTSDAVRFERFSLSGIASRRRLAGQR